MKPLSPAPIALIALICLPGLTLAADPAVPTQISNGRPKHGTQTPTLTETWRVGGEDEDVIFGRITDVISHPDGDVYILDNQLCQVTVVSKAGEYLRDLSRQGDGPGDVRQPVGIVFLADDILGIGTGFPAKLVTMHLDGTPLETYYPVGEPAEGAIGLMMNIQRVDGVLVASGGRAVFSNPSESHTARFLSVGNADYSAFHRIAERTTPIDPTGRVFDEVANYYIDYSWTLGRGGLIYAPMNRDAYEVSVFDQTGNVVRVFGREDEPRRRTQAEKDEISPVINTGGGPTPDWKIADHDPRVTRVLHNPDDGTIWVLTPHGTNDQPDGILETWDVFSPAGEYLKQVPIPLGDEMNDGAIYLVGDGRLVVVKGTASVFRADDEAEDEDETEVEPQEVICYDMRWDADPAADEGVARAK